jgi:hypothetical protein
MIRTTLAVAALFAAQALAAETPLLDYVPAGAKVIAGMHVDRTLSSPLGQYLLSQASLDDPAFRKFIDATGFDPRSDLREIVVAANDTQRHKGLVLARGVFNGPQILGTAQAQGGGTILTHNGVQVLQGRGRAAHWLAILDGTLAIAGDQEMVRGALDSRGAATANTSALGRKAASFDRLYDAWIVASGVFQMPARSGAPGSPTIPATALAAIQETSAGFEFGSTVRITGEAVTRSDKDAQALVDVVRFMTSMLQLNRESNPRFGQIEPILNSMQLRADANTVRITLSIPEADLEQLLKPHRRTRRAAR